MRIALTGTPVDIIAAASLDAATTYSIQAELPAHDPTNYVHLDDGAASPGSNAQIGLKVRDLETVLAKAGATGKLWAWSSAGVGSINVYEAV